MGMCDLAWPGTDLAFARIAAARNVPMCVSTASSTPLEEMIRLSEGRAWFQLYITGATTRPSASSSGRGPPATRCWCSPSTCRVWDDGRAISAMTFRTPLRFTPDKILDFALHPSWSLGTLAAGVPRMANFDGMVESKGYDRQAARTGADWDFLRPCATSGKDGSWSRASCRPRGVADRRPRLRRRLGVEPRRSPARVCALHDLGSPRDPERLGE